MPCHLRFLRVSLRALRAASSRGDTGVSLPPSGRKRGAFRRSRASNERRNVLTAGFRRRARRSFGFLVQFNFFGFFVQFISFHVQFNSFNSFYSSCAIRRSFGFFVQFILALFSFSALIIKRWALPHASPTLPRTLPARSRARSRARSTARSSARSPHAPPHAPPHALCPWHSGAFPCPQDSEREGERPRRERETKKRERDQEDPLRLWHIYVVLTYSTYLQ